MVKHIFGPVPSRRLGISLGIDIIPYKTCTLDCIYCECGQTTTLTTERRRYVKPDVVLAELETVLVKKVHLDHITFSGSGELTLNVDIGYLIREIKKMTAIAIAVLTNGSLLYQKEVRRELLLSQVVLPSLDAISSRVFSKINRPHPDLSVSRMMEGLLAFRKEYQGQIWLEVFVVKGINDDRDEIERLRRHIEKIKPDRIQLNTIDRPPACSGIEPADLPVLEEIVRLWKGMPVEIIKRVRKRDEITTFSQNLENNIMNTISRRPLTIDDLVPLTGMEKSEIYKYMDVLEKEKKIIPVIQGDKIFYTHLV